MSLKQKVQDNTEELAFLAELASTDTPAVPDAAPEQQTNAAASSRDADRAAALDTTAELAFLDGLAGTTPADQAAPSNHDRGLSFRAVALAYGPASACYEHF